MSSLTPQRIDELLAEAERIPEQLTADTREFGAKIDAKFSEFNQEVRAFGDELAGVVGWLEEQSRKDQ